MNNHLKKLLTCITAVTLISSVLVGCGSSSNTSKNQDASINKKVSLKLWIAENSATQKAINDLNAKFHQKYPLVNVTVSQFNLEDMRKNFVSTSVSGSGPDIILGPGDNIGVFQTGNLIQPIEDVVGKDFLNRFTKESVNAATYKGKVWETPDRVSSGLFLIYNKKIVDKAPGTFEDVQALGKKLQDEKKVQYGLVFDEVEPYYSSMFMSCFDASFFDNINAAKPKPTLNSSAMKQWSSYLNKLHNSGLIPKEADANMADNLFEEGKSAFIISGPWSFNTYKKAGVDFGIATLPTASGKLMKPLSSISGFAVSANVKDATKKAAVAKFLDFMSSKSSQLVLSDAHGKLPTNIETLKTDKYKTDPMYSIQTEQYKNCLPMPIIPQMRAIWDAIRPVQQDMFSGKVAPNEAPAQMQQKAEEEIKNLGVN
ncbi:extracellular solute-binding protein [Clostridium neuense]|uniref:Maltodextrin-binding protein n=1 Tax=Clostridium neuense TaxID=1728934 RepID=A0ABW8TQ85_9CLOT